MFAEFERKSWEIARALSPWTYDFLWPRRRVVRYLFSGGSSAAVNLFLLYLLTDILKVWYVVSSALAFSIAFVVSFIFQKFWTFEDRSTEDVHVQAAAYLAVALVNLGLNTLIIISLVEFLSIHYLVAQVMAGVVIACESFFVYRRFIFRSTRS